MVQSDNCALNNTFTGDAKTSLPYTIWLHCIDAVRAMESYGLTYVSQSTRNFRSNGDPDTTEPLQLDPAVDELLSFSTGEDVGTSDDLIGSRHLKNSAELRLIIYTEQRKFSIQSKIGRMLHKHSGPTDDGYDRLSCQTSGVDGPVKNTEEVISKRNVSSTADTVGKFAPRSSVPVPIMAPTSTAPQKQTFSFRVAPGNKKQKIASDAAAVEARKKQKKSNVRFKFSQGFSDAVRRVVTINEFI